MKYILEVTNISKRIKSVDILKEVSFSLKEGEIVGLIGENGAGKTSIMRILVGLTKQYQGMINWVGIEKIGCLIETPNFYPYMTGRQNLEYFAALKGVMKTEVDNVLNELKIDSFAEKKVKNYSLGMKQRLGIAQTLLGNPQVLILDEPTNGLDPSGIKEIRVFLKELTQKRKITILISSHALGEIEKLCDRVLLVCKGEIEREIVIKAEEEIQYFNVSTNDDFVALSILKSAGYQVTARANALEIVTHKEGKKCILSLLQKENLLILDFNEKKIELEDQYMSSLREEV